MAGILRSILLTSLFSISAYTSELKAQDCSSYDAMVKFYDLIQVIKDGDILSVQRLVEEGACVNEITFVRPSAKDVPVVKASLYGFEDIVEYLVQHGADINNVEYLHEGSDTLSALQAATAWNRDVSLIQYLLDAGADVNAGDQTMLYRTPLGNAARSGNETVFQMLLDRGALVNGFELLDVGNTFVVQKQAMTPKIAKKLIAKGAKIKVTDREKNTPLHLTRNPEIINLLLDHGADLNVENAFGETPVFGASYRNAFGDQMFQRENNCESAALFSKLGTNYSHRNKFGKTPFLQWASQGLIKSQPDQLFEGEVCTMLITLQNVKNIDVNVADIDTGLTPLMYAASWYSLDYSKYKEQLLRLLIEKGADLNAKDNKGNSVLSFATNPKIRKILSEAGAL